MSKEPPLLSEHYYHIYNRGNNGTDLFIEERNYAYFFKLYSHYIHPIANTYAYCLMKNHLHLLVRMRPEQDIQDCQSYYSQAFSNLFSTYSKAINKSYQRTGSLFEKPFKRVLVDSDSYFIHLISYIYRNPEKHGFVTDFRQYPYSSYQAIQQQKHSRVETQQVLAWFGSRLSFEVYHQQEHKAAIQHLIEDDV